MRNHENTGTALHDTFSTTVVAPSLGTSVDRLDVEYNKLAHRCKGTISTADTFDE